VIILVWLALPRDMGIPQVLSHHLEFKTQTGAVQTVDGVPVRIDTTPPIILGPPLRGGLWLADEGPGNAQSHHWGGLIADNGQLTIPQRYAIDLFGLDAKGHAVAAPIDKLAQSRLTDWAGFNSEVVAVADGVVRDIQDGVPTHDPLAAQAPANDLTPTSLYGNFVILEIAPSIFVHYAHLNTGSVTVKIGDRVKRGEILGHLGDTGQAGAPHLHIHVSNSLSFAESEGLPFQIDAFNLVGRGTESDALNTESDMHLSSGKGKAVHDAMPLNGDVLEF
jgi:murein DD-endopeptidase MepM/ murein hydrolase activator NlpD